MKGKTLIALTVVMLPLAGFADEAGSNDAAPPIESRWWPAQAVPKGIVSTATRGDSPARRIAYEMMVQSIAGLAAKSVNEGRGDELVWVSTGNVDVEDWLARRLEKQPQLEMRGAFDPWALVDRYAQRGLIKGYFLYRSDTSAGEFNQYRRNINCSVNVATSLAGLFDGIIVDEQLEPLARQHGLKRLMDVREKTQAWCFETYRERFNRTVVCTQDPRKPNVRDLAIAQKAFATYGDDAPYPTVMSWLAPLSPILGWNGGDEFKATELSSRWGHLQTATDWCSNLPVLMAGTEKAPHRRTSGFDPGTIDWNDARSGVSFVTTDGDNVQWFEGNFFRSSEGASYWGNPRRGAIPFGWSCCFAQLAQLCPEATDYALSTRSPNDSFVEWLGGYYFPDLFAANRPDPGELLARHARRTWMLMQKNNTRVIGFNVAKYDSAAALQAYRIFAEQTTGLLGIMVFEYDRYEAGAGRVFWVKDRTGIDVPVVSARYAIWNHTNERRGSGTPAKIAREIRQTVEGKDSPAGGSPRYDWVIAHAWSWFKSAPGSDENTENIPQENAEAHGGIRGYLPVLWCAERLPASIRVVSPEEMFWRIRMNHDREQTKKLIRTWSQ